MPISVNPVFPVIADQAAIPNLVLQSGTVIDARVLKVLDNNLVRIAIAGLSIDVLSEVELQGGAALKLAVSQTPTGLRLAIVPPADTAGLSATTLSAVQAANIPPLAANRPASDAVASALSPLEALAVTAAAQNAAAKQAGLSPLFANVAAAAVSGNLPEPLQRAAQQLLALRPDLTADLSGGDIKSAFRKSGLFLESSLASGLLVSGTPASSTPVSSTVASGALPQAVPDLKAALIVFRQVLSTWLNEAASGNPAGSPASQQTLPSVEQEAQRATVSLVPGIVAEEMATSRNVSSGAQSSNGGGRVAVIGQNIAKAASSEVLEALQTMVDGKAFAGLPEARTFARAVHVGEAGLARGDVLPPPFRGAEPAPQAIAAPSIVPDAAPAEIARRLTDDAEGAISRQVLLQIASLPDRVDAPGVRNDPASPRWSFEIPFATPQGTAVAQFEISRDGGGQAVAAAGRVWRARFSLNVEPAGPVHALVSLNGETTSVRMWAERPETAIRLRDNAFQLGSALRQAELEPGDIVIGGGVPPMPAAPPTGHFLDRAT